MVKTTLYWVATFYHFFQQHRLDQKREVLREAMQNYKVCGTIILAPEGVNATIAADRKNLEQMLQYIEQILAIKINNCKESWCDKKPFLRSKVKLKREIVTMGVRGLTLDKRGDYVNAKQWNALLNCDKTLVIDTRNNYEISIGSFDKAVAINTDNFKDFPQRVTQLLQQSRKKSVAMFCTGGIRCEKAGAFVKQFGVENVYQLQGGILQYLQDEQHSKTNKWRGECFVFDDRVSVDKNLARGKCEQCFACRMPLRPIELESPHYSKGVSCHHCYNKITPKQFNRFSERQKQIQLADKKGRKHLG